MLLIFVILTAVIVIYKARASKETSIMKSIIINWTIFIISLIILMISLKLFWNTGVYADEYGSYPVLISGGWFWLYMDWLRLGFVYVLCIITGFNAFKRII